MPLKHFSDRHLVRLLATETRRTDTTSHELARSHVALGRYLAGELLDYFEVEACEIQHPQGVRSGWQIANESGLALIPFMRAGLYVADGVREVLQRPPMLHVRPTRDVGLPAAELAALDALAVTTTVLIDAVVNTGASLEPVLAQLAARQQRVFVLALVCPVATADRLASSWPGVTFLFARLSENQYVGKGSTDTGNRLFGTSRTSG